MSELISLATRISFYDGPPTSGSIPWSTSGTFGMSGSSPNGVVIKLDLTGSLSSTISGRLFCGSNTILSIPITNHSFSGLVNIYAFDIDTLNSTYSGNISIEQNASVINIDISKFYEKDGVLYVALLPPQSYLGHYVEFSSTNCSLLVNNVLTTMPAFSIINEQTDLDGYTVLYRCRKDIVSVEASFSSLSFNSISAKIITNHLVNDSNSSAFEVWSFAGPFVVGACSTSNSMILQGYVSYGGVDYSSNPVNFQCKIKCLLPLLINYSQNETETSRVFKMYYPGSVITHTQDSGFKVPLIVVIHGGLWVSKKYTLSGNSPTPLNTMIFDKWESNNDYDSNAQNNASGDDFYIRNLLRLGFAVCLMDYTGINRGGTCSTMISDINLLVNYLYSCHYPLHIKIDKLCLWGYSSGGHLALLYSYLSKIQSNPYNVDCPFDIKLVVSEAGPVDLSFMPTIGGPPNIFIDTYNDFCHACTYYNFDIPSDPSELTYDQYRRTILSSVYSLCGGININPYNIGNFPDFDDINNNYPDWVLKTTAFSPITYASSQSPFTFLSYSPCDERVYHCQVDWLMNQLDEGLFSYNCTICSHDGFTYHLSNSNGLLENALVMYFEE